MIPTGLLMIVLKFYLDLEWPVLIGATFFIIIGLVVGLSLEKLKLDIKSQKFFYEKRFWPLSRVVYEDSFSALKKIWIYDNSLDLSSRAQGKVSVQPAWCLTLIIEGKKQYGPLIGVFTNEKEALKESEILSSLLKIPISRQL
jgi:hypothetical protein